MAIRIRSLFKKWKSPALFLSPATNAHGDGRLNPRLINTAFNEVCSLVGVEGHTPHDARHAMGRHLIEKTGNIAAVQRQLVRIGVSHLFEDVENPIGFGSDRKIEKIMIPTLIIHGEADRIIPVEEGKALYSLSGAQEKEAIFISNAGHNDLFEWDLERYMEGINQFTQE